MGWCPARPRRDKHPPSPRLWLQGAWWRLWFPGAPKLASLVPPRCFPLQGLPFSYVAVTQESQGPVGEAHLLPSISALETGTRLAGDKLAGGEISPMGSHCPGGRVVSYMGGVPLLSGRLHGLQEEGLWFNPWQHRGKGFHTAGAEQELQRY